MLNQQVFYQAVLMTQCHHMLMSPHNALSGLLGHDSFLLWGKFQEAGITGGGGDKLGGPFPPISNHPKSTLTKYHCLLPTVSLGERNNLVITIQLLAPWPIRVSLVHERQAQG